MSNHRVLTRDELHKIISEEIDRVNDIVIYHKIAAAEARRLRYEGHSLQVINEGAVDALLAVAQEAPSGAIDMLKVNIIRHIQIGMGFSPDSFLGRVTQNIIEAITLSDLGGYFGPEKCDKFAEMFLQGFAETMVEPAGNRLALAFGFNPRGNLWLAFRETLTNAILAEDGVGGQIKTQLKEFACNIDLGEMMSGARETGERAVSSITGGAAAASSTTPLPGTSLSTRDPGSGVDVARQRLGLDD